MKLNHAQSETANREAELRRLMGVGSGDLLGCFLWYLKFTVIKIASILFDIFYLSCHYKFGAFSSNKQCNAIAIGRCAKNDATWGDVAQRYINHVSFSRRGEQLPAPSHRHTNKRITNTVSLKRRNCFYDP